MTFATLFCIGHSCVIFHLCLCHCMSLCLVMPLWCLCADSVANPFSESMSRFWFTGKEIYNESVCIVWIRFEKNKWFFVQFWLLQIGLVWQPMLIIDFPFRSFCLFVKFGHQLYVVFFFTFFIFNWRYWTIQMMNDCLFCKLAWQIRWRHYWI